MKPCIQHLVNCPNNESITLEKPLVVQIIGSRYYDNQSNNKKRIIYTISDGENFCSAFILPQLEDYKLYQIIGFRKITIIKYQAKNEEHPLLILERISTISTKGERIGSPRIIDNFSTIQSYKVLPQKQDQNPSQNVLIDFY